jgi:hypothetical protein
MHFHLGCNFVEFLFEPLVNAELQQKMSDRIIDQCQKWLPFIRVVNVSITFHEDNPKIPENGCGVAMTYSMISKPSNLGSLFQVVPGP